VRNRLPLGRRLLLIVALGSLAGAGCSGGEPTPPVATKPGARDLSWTGTPRIVRPPRLPNDRILAGTVRNDSIRAVGLSQSDLRVVDARGRRVNASAVFLRTFVHGLYPPGREPRRLPESELRRTGRKAVIASRGTAPLTVSWRQRPGARPPVRIEYGAGSLPVPAS